MSSNMYQLDYMTLALRVHTSRHDTAIQALPSVVSRKRHLLRTDYCPELQCRQQSPF